MNLRELTKYKGLENQKTLKELIDAFMYSYGINEQIALLALFYDIDHNQPLIVDDLVQQIDLIEKDKIIYVVLKKDQKVAILKQILEHKKGRNDDAVAHNEGMRAYAKMHED